MSEKELEILKFIFDGRLSLFNTRRDHEWRVIVSAMLLMGAVDATLLTQNIKLTERQVDFWWFALFFLFFSIAWYQWGVQVRNRVDRLSMDNVLHRMCDELQIPADNDLRAGVDRENENMPHSRRDFILHFTYLWAFIPQMLVLFVATLLSGYLPYLVKPASEKSPCCPACCPSQDNRTAPGCCVDLRCAPCPDATANKCPPNPCTATPPAPCPDLTGTNAALAVCVKSGGFQQISAKTMGRTLARRPA